MCMELNTDLEKIHCMYSKSPTGSTVQQLRALWPTRGLKSSGSALDECMCCTLARMAALLLAEQAQAAYYEHT